PARTVAPGPIRPCDQPRRDALGGLHLDRAEHSRPHACRKNDCRGDGAAWCVVSAQRAPSIPRTSLGVVRRNRGARVRRTRRTGAGRVIVHEPATGKGLLTLEQLREAATSGAIETVVVGFTDHYGRLMGKRYDAELFVDETATQGTHGCDYLLTTDMEMEPVQGYTFANWEK